MAYKTDANAPIRNGTVPLDNATMRIQFPEHDFNAYWLFGAIRGEGEFQAIKVGFSIGAFDGYDWGFKNVIPDTNHCWYGISLIGAERTIAFSEMPIQRHEFEYDHSKLDVKLGDRLRVTAEWPKMHWYASNADKSLVVEFEATMGIVHWCNDMVHKGTTWNTWAVPDFEYTGTITVDGKKPPFSGIGAIDRPAGRLFKSPTSPGIGHWQWDGLMINDTFGLCQWNIVNGEGSQMVNVGVTNFPDGNYHTGTLKLAYTKYEDRGDIPVAREWLCELQCDHGTFEYKVAGVGQEWDGTPQEPGVALPNLLLLVDGKFTSNTGEVLRIKGKGTGEQVLCEWNPKTNQKSKPW